MDELSRLVANAHALVADGYYRTEGGASRAPSFLETLGRTGQPSDVIAEIKFTSPTASSGKAPQDFERILRGLVAAGPLGLSVLAEPRIFGGDLRFVREASTRGLPVLMKDIVVDPVQLEAAADRGASAALVIQSLFSRGLLDGPSQGFVDAAHEHDLDVVLEVHTLDEWDAASRTDADILGINNRDLATMRLDLDTTSRILSARRKDRPVIAMSGVERRPQVDALLRAGADAVLVGSSLMAHADPGKRLEELIHG